MPMNRRLPEGTFAYKHIKSKNLWIMINRDLGIIYKMKPVRKNGIGYWLIEEYPLSAGMSGCGCGGY